jgi:hypothetical protein
MINKSREEIAWIAGLLEGEGSFYLNHGNGHAVIIAVCMTDLDVIENAANILGGTGNIYAQEKGKFKTTYTFRVYGSDLSVEWMNILYPLMGIRRQQRIREILEFWNNREDKSHRMHRVNIENNVIKGFAKIKKISIEEAKKFAQEKKIIS